MSGGAEMAEHEYTNRQGYQENFLSVTESVSLPDFSRIRDLFMPGLKNDSPYEIPYHHFSVILHQKRKFPLLTATNIDGTAFQPHARVDRWRKDPRAGEFQWGDELYTAARSDFDKGHMTRREDPAWGPEGFRADQDTFHFTNAVPQVHKLNAYTWKELEDHVLHFGAIAAGMRICVFTGPVLDQHDHPFVTPVHGVEIHIPNRFWKVIVWEKHGKGLHAVGFVLSQEKELIDNGIVRPGIINTRGVSADDVFERITFKSGTTYQVPLPYIESITGIKFSWKKTTFPYTETRAREVLAIREANREVQPIPGRESGRRTIENIVL
jgi:endonuclease G